MRAVPTPRPGPCALIALLALISSHAPGALAAEWDAMRDRQRDALRAAEGRIAEIEAREPGAAADRAALADKLTRDRIVRATAALASRPATDRPREDDAARLAAVTRQWGEHGAERGKLGQFRAGLQKNLALAEANLAAAVAALDALSRRVQESGLSAALARIEVAAGEAGARLGARWQREHAARERERLEREREAGARERGVR